MSEAPKGTNETHDIPKKRISEVKAAKRAKRKVGKATRKRNRRG